MFGKKNKRIKELEGQLKQKDEDVRDLVEEVKKLRKLLQNNKIDSSTETFHNVMSLLRLNSIVINENNCTIQIPHKIKPAYQSDPYIRDGMYYDIEIPHIRFRVSESIYEEYMKGR